MIRSRAGRAAIALALLVTCALAVPAWGQGQRPQPIRGQTLALTLVDARGSFFTGGESALRDSLPTTWMRRALTSSHDGFLAMISLGNADIGRTLGDRLDQLAAYRDIDETRSWLVSVLSQAVPLSSPRFDSVGIIIATDEDLDPEERPRIDRAIDLLRGSDGILLLGRGTSPDADLVVIYQVGPDISAGARRDVRIKNTLRLARLEIVESAITLPLQLPPEPDVASPSPAQPLG